LLKPAVEIQSIEGPKVGVDADGGAHSLDESRRPDSTVDLLVIGERHVHVGALRVFEALG